jgi:hypothetical protein
MKQMTSTSSLSNSVAALTSYAMLPVTPCSAAPLSAVAIEAS